MTEIDEFMKIRMQDKGYCHVQSGPGSESQKRAKRLCCEYNKTSPDEELKRNAILHELLGTCSDSFIIQPNFQCDYGLNIHIHGFTFINYNCCMLDTSPIHIGHMTFIAPGCVISCAGHAIHPRQLCHHLLCQFRNDAHYHFDFPIRMVLSRTACCTTEGFHGVVRPRSFARDRSGPVYKRAGDARCTAGKFTLHTG